MGTIVELRHAYVAWHHPLSKVQLSPKPSLKPLAKFHLCPVDASSRMINGVNLLPNTITFWLLLNTTSFVGLLTIYSPYSMILSIVHAIKISSEKVSSFRKFCRSQFANFILLLFSKSVRASSTPFLYERYPRSCLKILTRDQLEIFSSPATDTLHSFSHLFDHSFGRDNAKE